MISPSAQPVSFISHLKTLEVLVNQQTPEWVKEMRMAGLTRFKTLSFPTIKDEEWKYTSLEPLIVRKFSLAQEQRPENLESLENYLDRSQINIVFVNGFFSRDLSHINDLPRGLAIQNIEEAIVQQPEEIKGYLSKYDRNREGTFLALHQAYFRHGAYIKVEKNAMINTLIHIVHLTAEEANETISFPRSLIVLGPSSETTVLESHISFENSIYFSDALTDIFVAENAKLHYCKGQNESPQAFHIGTTRLWQERDSDVECFSLATGSVLTRNDLSVILDGPGAHVTLNGLYAITDKQHVDNHTAVNHKAPNCTSRELYKGILHNQARGVFNGKIFVQREAQLTNAYQLNKNLLLSKGCQIDTKPQLEIFADDVKCTHGATIGQLNEEEMFYLRSRGIPRGTAIKILCRGFMEDVLNEIKHPVIHAKLEKLLARVLGVIS